jgi:hypothetical protein
LLGSSRSTFEIHVTFFEQMLLFTTSIIDYLTFQAAKSNDLQLVNYVELSKTSEYTIFLWVGSMLIGPNSFKLRFKKLFWHSCDQHNNWEWSCTLYVTKDQYSAVVSRHNWEILVHKTCDNSNKLLVTKSIFIHESSIGSIGMWFLSANCHYRRTPVCLCTTKD